MWHGRPSAGCRRRSNPNPNPNSNPNPNPDSTQVPKEIDIYWPEDWQFYTAEVPLELGPGLGPANPNANPNPNPNPDPRPNPNPNPDPNQVRGCDASTGRHEVYYLFDKQAS